MSIITLTTDFGLKDHFVGALKGKIISAYQEVTIIDITHEIDLFNIFEASYCIAAAYKNFPKGSVHLIGVDSERSENKQHIAMQWDDHYFICADNGILSALTQKKVAQKIVAINIHDRLHSDATDMDVFTTVACHIARGGLLNVIGTEIKELKPINEFIATVSDDGKTIKGSVIYIDHFGNCVTNISKRLFNEIALGRNFEIRFHNKKITTLHKQYSDFKTSERFPLKSFEGSSLALFNENDYLEIAVYKSISKTVSSAHTLLGLKFRDTVTIQFKN